MVYNYYLLNNISWYTVQQKLVNTAWMQLISYCLMCLCLINICPCKSADMEQLSNTFLVAWVLLCLLHNLYLGTFGILVYWSQWKSFSQMLENSKSISFKAALEGGISHLPMFFQACRCTSSAFYQVCYFPSRNLYAWKPCSEISDDSRQHNYRTWHWACMSMLHLYI